MELDFQRDAWIPYPTGLIRVVARLPLVLFRLGLGELLRALHLMVLTTQGRKSGLPRRTPIEYRRHGSKVYLVSAWDTRPDWVQNLLAVPEATVQIGGRTYQARGQRVTDNAEALRALNLFRRIAPARYDVVLSRLVEGKVNARTLPEFSGQFTILRLDLTTEPPVLPPLQPNWTWLWPLGLLALAGIIIVVGLARSRR